MMKKDLTSAFVAILGLSVWVAGAAATGELLHLPFHEHIQCLYFSDLEEYWLNSGNDLKVGLASELDRYLWEKFASDGYIRTDNIHVTLHGSMIISDGETDESLRSFLRRRGNQKEQCELDLELAGDIVFADVNDDARHDKAFEDHSPSLVARRSKIYAQVAHSLLGGRDHWFTATSETNGTLAEQVSDNPRILQQACVSMVHSNYEFRANEFMCSSNGPFFFGFTSSGELGIWKGWRKVWSAGISDVGMMTLQIDGNLVVRNKTNTAVWDSKTNGPVDSGGDVRIADNGEVTIVNSRANKSLKIAPSLDNLQDCVTQMNVKDRLKSGERICSADERYSFGLSSNGDLGIWEGPKQVWSARTCCKGVGTTAYMQADGNFVVRSGNGVVLWESVTGGTELVDAVASVSTTGVVSILNVNAGKRVSIKPFGQVQPPVEENPAGPTVQACLEQVSGRIDFQTGQFICSLSGRYRFGIALSGDLQLLDGTKLLWSAGTCCAKDGVFAVLQGGDGNLVVRNAAFQGLWTSGTSDLNENANSTLSLTDSGTAAITNPAGLRVWAVAPHPVCLAQVTGEFTLSEGQFICSANERFRFGVNDGDVSLWDGDSLVWSSGLRYRRAGVYLQIQRDGNLVVRSTESNQSLWSTGTVGNTGASLRLDANGVARIVSSGGETLWSVTRSLPSLPPATPSPRSNLTPSPLPTPAPIVEAPILKAPPIDPSLQICLEPVVGNVVLSKGDFFCSPNKKYKFGLTSNGDLALLKGGSKIWSANTCCTGEEVIARLQVDGNLVVSKSRTNTVIWASGSASLDTDIASLVVGDDGIVTITDTNMGHVWSSAISNEQRVVATSLEGKVMAGYQGWFYAEGDGGFNKWNHWSTPRTLPGPSTITIDVWPDLRELDDDELYPTGFKYKDGSTAGLYSAYNAKTVERHTRWMKDYGIDGVFVQRFIGSALAFRPVVDKILANVRSGSEKYGRTFVTMYDIGNGDDANIVEDVINDWKHLVDNEHITKSKQYLRHRGRPLVAIWGFGFSDRIGDPGQVAAIIDWFKNAAEDKYKATLMGGVPTGWRDLSRDSKTAAAWASIYRSYDVISPWAVGRMVDNRTADYFRARYIEPDLAECNRLGIDYLPVAFPGFSFANLKPGKPFNEIPRKGGTFFWRQLHNAAAAGAKQIYVAMFDEVDEASAIFKIAANIQQTPTQGRFLTSGWDQGYSNTPGDWYLNLTGTVAGLLKEGKNVPLDMPALP